MIYAVLTVTLCKIILKSLQKKREKHVLNVQIIEIV